MNTDTAALEKSLMYTPEFVTTIPAITSLLAKLPNQFFEGRRRWSRREIDVHNGCIVGAYYVAENEPDYPEVLHVVNPR